MIQGTPREANSLSPVPSAARPSRTARLMLFSFMARYSAAANIFSSSAADRIGTPSIDFDGCPSTPTSGLPNQCHPVELAVEIGFENVGGREVHRRAIVPKRDVALVPLEAHGVFGTRDVLPKDLEDFLALARRQPDDRFEE